jgi:hypothetical protein
MTWDYLLNSPVFSGLRSAQNSPDRTQQEDFALEGQESQSEPQSEEQPSAAQLEIEAAVAGLSPPKLSEPEPEPIPEEEEEEAEAKGPGSPPVERYLDESCLDLEEESAGGESYEEAFMLDFIRAYDGALAAFVRRSLTDAYENSTKPLSSDSFWAFRAVPIAHYAAERLRWVDTPGSTEHLSFARNSVAPSVAGMRLFLSEIKKRRWG